MKKLLMAAALSVLLASSAKADLLITGVVDGTQTGGNPKAIELVATSNIADLSDFWILRDTNGTSGGPFTVSSSFNLPSVALSAGDFYYVYGNSDTVTYLESEGFGDTGSSTAVLNGVANHNGDDILALSTSINAADVFDAFGLLGQGDTDFAANSYAYRQAGTAANATGVSDAGNFDITSYSDAGLTSTFGTYAVSAVPEPSSIAVLGLLAGVGMIRRRR